MRLHALLVLAFMAILQPACGRDEPRPPAGAASRENTGAHADASVVPGSYEDWCGEHAVPESMCTRCNPTLVAAFKATNDWCAEHNLPESQCLACNPDLKIVRPPKPEGQ
jgi:hypothetical protein